MKKLISLMLVLIIFSVVITGCSKNTDINDDNEIPEQPEVTTEDISQEATTGWVDDTEEVEIGSMV